MVHSKGDHRAYLSWLQTSTKSSGMLDKAMGSPRCTIALLRNLDRVQELRSMHWKMTKKFIITQTKHPVTTGGTPITTWIPNHLMFTLEYVSYISTKKQTKQTKVLNCTPYTHTTRPIRTCTLPT